MAKTRAAKDRTNKRNNKKRKLGLKTKQQQKKLKQKNPIQDQDPILSESASESDNPSSPTRIHHLLEPYTKDQLITFLLDAAQSDPSLLARIRSVADSDVSHRKIFVHGLGWDTTKEILLEVFSPYGPVEDCNVVVDKTTGRAKGYGFVLFKTRSAAVKALKQPQKRIKNRLASCQLASVGPVAGAGGTGSAGGSDGRRIYVSNVYADAPPDKLKDFFGKFGELESGPIGYDMLTGKSRGFAIFVYKNQEGAKRALEEPYKMFEGHQLHCQLATDSSQKGKAAAVPPQPLLGVAPQPVLAAVAAAQNLALLGQNPAYSALLAQNPLLAAAAFNPAAAGLLNPTVGQGYGGVGMGGGGGAPSVLGAYGVGQGTAAGLQGMQGYQGSAAGLQGMQGYQGSQIGQTSSGKPGGTFGGFSSSYVW